jgi:CBS domain-containing protein
MRVKEIMSNEPHTIKPDTSIKEAAEIMRDCDCGYLPVGENDRFTGALTDRDIVVRVIAEGRNLETATAKEAMTEELQYCFEDDELESAGELMKQQQIRRLAVFNSDKKLTGIISVSDIACYDEKMVGVIEGTVCKKAA